MTIATTKERPNGDRTGGTTVRPIDGGPVQGGPVPGPAETARVLDRTDDGLLVAYAGAVRPARVALSCLVQPEPGDLALVAATGAGLFVLALLERPAPAPLRLILGAEAEIAATGTLTLLGGHGLTLTSPGQVALTADTIEMQSRGARLLIDELAHVGRAVTAQVGKLRLVGEVAETLVDRLLTRARRSFRFIAEGEHLRARDIDHRAEETVQLRGRTAFVTADTLVKVDADQIHMG